MDLKSIDDIDFNQNGIKILPESISRLQVLRYLRLEFNELTTLPEALKEMNRLESLDVMGNPFMLRKRSKKVASILRVLRKKEINVWTE